MKEPSDFRDQNTAVLLSLFTSMPKELGFDASHMLLATIIYAHQSAAGGSVAGTLVGKTIAGSFTPSTRALIRACLHRTLDEFPHEEVSLEDSRIVDGYFSEFDKALNKLQSITQGLKEGFRGKASE